MHTRRDGTHQNSTNPTQNGFGDGISYSQECFLISGHVVHETKIMLRHDPTIHSSTLYMSFQFSLFRVVGGLQTILAVSGEEVGTDTIVQ